MLYTFTSGYIVVGWVVLGWLFASQSLDELFDQEPPAGAKASEQSLYKMFFVAMLLALALGWPITLWAYLDGDDEL